MDMEALEVLNLVISGIPSIPEGEDILRVAQIFGFKPCYKWNTFNTPSRCSIHAFSIRRFKPCYKWNTFNT